MKRSIFLLPFLLALISLHAQLPNFDAKDQPAAPDYSLEKNWSALPFRVDAADKIPSSETWIDDSLKTVDVFYIYPTLYMSGKTWNADLANKSLNKKLDNKPVRYQASVFNASCRVYAPRYRQSIIKAFYDHENGEKSLAFAYQDVKKAFQYYLDHYNHGRPFIIASHSQGSHHARRLLREMIDTTALRNRMVAAYVIGFGMDKNSYRNLKPCEDAKQTGCYITWASYKRGYLPTADNSDLFGNVCVNPLSWKCDTVNIDRSKSMDAILLNFNKRYSTGAQIHDHYLWIDTNTPFVRSFNVMHIADYNLFWYDIRKNVADRIKAYLSVAAF
jgi:hypothetical protein